MTQEFRLTVKEEMETVSARILHAPKLKYNESKTPVNGTWQVHGLKFNEPKHLNWWAIVNLSGTTIVNFVMQEFVRMLQSTG